LRRIPVASFRELPAASPGYVEMDLVSHDGGKAAGDHCYTLTVTDRCTGWTEIVPVPSRAQIYVFAALTGVLARRANILQPSMALLEKVRTGSRIQKKYGPLQTPLHQLLQAPEVSDASKARLLRQLRDVDPVSLQWDIGILQVRLLGKTSQDIFLGAVTRATFHYDS
jgi:hypothetical protein